MLHARPDYNRIQDPANLIPADEPVFLLRAQDTHAITAVLSWANSVEESGGDPRMVEMARQQAEAMQRWQQAHPVRLNPDVGLDHDEPKYSYIGKQPDLPEDLGATSRRTIHKQSSAELSSRAAAIMSMDNDEMRKHFIGVNGISGSLPLGEPILDPDFCSLVRSLAASVVSQDETKGQ